jgi:plastocyanin
MAPRHIVNAALTQTLSRYSKMTSVMNTIGPRAGASATALATIMLLLGCGGGATDPSGAPPTAAAAKTVNATASLAFDPPSLAVTAGDTVTFAFGNVEHNVFFDAQNDAPADIGGRNAQVSVRRVFATVGTYRYTCHIHPSMSGTVVVRAPGGTTTSGY